MPSQKTGTEMNSDGSDCRPARSHPMPIMFGIAASTMMRNRAAPKAKRGEQQRGRQVGGKLLAHRHAGLDGVAEIAGRKLPTVVR